MHQSFKKFFLVVIVLILLLLFFLFDARLGGFPQCPFYLLTGWFCPGCGSQRAISALVHGDVFQALRYNTLMMMFLPLLLYSAFVKFKYDGVQKIKLLYSPVFVKIILMVVVSFWIFRNIPVFPFSILAPIN